MGKYKIAILFVAIFAIGGTAFNIAGPKIIGKATTEIFNGLVSKVSGGSGIDFGKVGQILLGAMGALLCQRYTFLYTGLYYDRNLTEDDLPPEKRNFGKNQPYAYELF